MGEFETVRTTAVKVFNITQHNNGFICEIKLSEFEKIHFSMDDDDDEDD